MLTFDTNLGLMCEDTDSIRLEIQEIFKSALGSDLDVDPESPQGQIIDSLTAMVVDRDSTLLELANQLDPYKSEGIFQEALGHLYFLERKTASKTIVECLCTGLKNTIIPRSTFVKSDNNILFSSIDDATIGEDGTVKVYFECENDGAVAVNAGEINKIISVISGFDEVINLESGIIGNEEETRSEFEKRRVLSIAKNSQGSINAILGEIASIENIIDFLLIENPKNTAISVNSVTIDPHSLYICALGGSEEDIARALYTKKDIGCATSFNHDDNVEISYKDEECGAQYSYNILRPSALDFYIKVQITAKDDGSYPDSSKIKEAILANFYGKSTDIENNQRLRIGEKVLATRFYYALLSEGINELLSLKISNDNSTFHDEIQISAKEYPQLLEENIIILEV